MDMKLRNKLDKEIELRLNDELWSVRIASHIVASNHSQSMPNQPSFINKIKLSTIASTAALIVAVFGLSGIFYYKPGPAKESQKAYMQTPHMGMTLRRSPGPSIKVPASFPVHLNDTMFHDNLDNIIEASINMRYK